MIKMLMDEVDKQAKRINFLETKVTHQRQQIISLEDALFINRSHRLLLRSTGNAQKGYFYGGARTASQSRIHSAYPRNATRSR